MESGHYKQTRIPSVLLAPTGGVSIQRVLENAYYVIVNSTQPEFVKDRAETALDDLELLLKHIHRD